MNKESVVFTYGRFNPPHLGHKMMIAEMLKFNKKVVVVVSHSKNNNKNPLSVSQKIGILKTWFPKLDIRASSKNMSIAKIANSFKNDSIMVVGEDRANSFKFIPVKKQSVPRPTGAYSATAARTAARSGKIKNFEKVTGYKNPNIINTIRTPSKRSSK